MRQQHKSSVGALGAIIIVGWLLVCAALTYQQFGAYAALFFTQYGPRYFPSLMRVLGRG